MKVLAVTGRRAEKMVKESANGADVLVLDVEIAAFITPELLVRLRQGIMILSSFRVR